MKPKYKVGDYLMMHDGGIYQVRGIHVNIYAKNDEDFSSNVQYEFTTVDDYVDEDDILCKMVPAKK